MCSGEAVLESDSTVQVFGLQRHFNNRSFWSITDSWFEIKQGQLFCLLGPNGAGVPLPSAPFRSQAVSNLYVCQVQQDVHRL
jgi:hypothetical protein